MKLEDAPAPVVFSPAMFFHVVAFAPLAITSGSLFFYYSKQPLVALAVKVPLLSDAMTELPESRLFSVGMNIIAWLTVPVYLIIVRLLKLKSQVEEVDQKTSIKIADAIRSIACVLGFFSLLGLSSVTVRESATFHTICANVFLGSISVFFLLVDFTFRQVRLPATPVDWAWDLFIPAAFAASCAITRTPDVSDALHSTAGVLQYIGGAAIFLKFARVWTRFPKIGLLLTRKVE
jgi:uncharacterized membrane protein